MKRDWNLIRDILTAIEEDRCKKYIDNAGNSEEWQDGLDNDQIKNEYIKRRKLINGHIRLLIDAGLISQINSNIWVLEKDTFSNRGINQAIRNRNGGASGYVFNYESLELSMEGHDLLQHMRTPKVWNKAKEIADKAGVALTLDFLRTTLPHIPSMLTQEVKACGIN